MELKNIAVLGPRGNVGKAIIAELLKEPGRWNITAITRPGSTYESPAGSNITHKTADFETLDSIAASLVGQDTVVNCVSGSATQYDPSKRIIDAAVQAGVKFFFANEFVGHLTSVQFGRLPEMVVGAKVRIRQYLEELGKAGKLSWTSLNGGPFFDMWVMKGPAGFDVKNRKARIYGTGDNSLFWTPLSTMASAAAHMLSHPQKILNRPIYIAPIPNLSQNVILGKLREVVGGEWEVEHVDVEKINKNARAALEKGEVAKAMKGLTVSNQFYEEDAGNDFSALVENDLVGVQEMSVEDAVRQAIEIYGTDSAVVEVLFRVEACEV